MKPLSFALLLGLLQLLSLSVSQEGNSISVEVSVEGRIERMSFPVDPSAAQKRYAALMFAEEHGIREGAGCNRVEGVECVVKRLEAVIDRALNARKQFEGGVPNDEGRIGKQEWN